LALISVHRLLLGMVSENTGDYATAGKIVVLKIGMVLGGPVSTTLSHAKFFLDLAASPSKEDRVARFCTEL
jgi:hypothetical protein